MIIWVLYDIKNNSARNYVAKVCKHAGLYRVQYSCFLGSLNDNEKDSLELQIEKVINEDTDKIYIFRMNKEQLKDYLTRETHATEKKPALIDRFLEGATELDVDLVSDGKKVIIGAIMEQIEMAGVHSGDSACVIPPQSLTDKQIESVIEVSNKVAESFEIVGVANIQIALKGKDRPAPKATRRKLLQSGKTRCHHWCEGKCD